MTKPELIKYFNEHVMYELLMLRYSKKCLEGCGDQMLWNAMFAAFNVSARNIYEFFSTSDNRCVRLSDFKGHYGTFQRSSIAKITGTLGKLNAQCTHLGRKRAMLSSEKVTLERIREMFEWAESNMVAFIESTDFKSEVDLERADVSKRAKLLDFMLESTRPSATNISGMFATQAVPKTPDRKDQRR